MNQMGLAPTVSRPLPIFIPDLNASVEAGHGTDNLDEVETRRLRLLKEMLDTERKYVADLDFLLVSYSMSKGSFGFLIHLLRLIQEYYNALKASRVCLATEILTIFPNLEELVEFQHRFLSKMEASVAASYERVGLVFTKLVGCASVCSSFSVRESELAIRNHCLPPSTRRCASISRPQTSSS